MAVGRPRGKRKSERKAAARGVLHDDSRMVPDRDVVGIGTPQAPSSFLKQQALVQVDNWLWSLRRAKITVKPKPCLLIKEIEPHQ